MPTHMRNPQIAAPQKLRQFRHGRHLINSVLLLVVTAATLCAGFVGMSGIIA